MPTRGSPRLVEPRLGLLGEPVEQRPARRGPRSPCESTCTVPPDSPNPRESQVSTLKPARRSGPVPTLPVAFEDALSGFCVAAAAPAVRLQDRRRPLPAGLRGVEADVDLRAVERGDDGIASGGGRGVASKREASEGRAIARNMVPTGSRGAGSRA